MQRNKVVVIVEMNDGDFDLIKTRQDNSKRKRKKVGKVHLKVLTMPLRKSDKSQREKNELLGEIYNELKAANSCHQPQPTRITEEQNFLNQLQAILGCFSYPISVGQLVLLKHFHKRWPCWYQGSKNYTQMKIHPASTMHRVIFKRKSWSTDHEKT